MEHTFVRIFLLSGRAAETLPEITDVVEEVLEAEERATGAARKLTLEMGDGKDPATLFWLRVRAPRSHAATDMASSSSAAEEHHPRGPPLVGWWVGERDSGRRSDRGASPKP